MAEYVCLPAGHSGQAGPERSQYWPLHRSVMKMWRTEESIQPLGLTVTVATT